MFEDTGQKITEIAIDAVQLCEVIHQFADDLSTPQNVAELIKRMDIGAIATSVILIMVGKSQTLTMHQLNVNRKMEWDEITAVWHLCCWLDDQVSGRRSQLTPEKYLAEVEADVLNNYHNAGKHSKKISQLVKAGKIAPMWLFPSGFGYSYVEGGGVLFMVGGAGWKSATYHDN